MGWRRKKRQEDEAEPSAPPLDALAPQQATVVPMQYYLYPHLPMQQQHPAPLPPLQPQGLYPQLVASPQQPPLVAAPQPAEEEDVRIQKKSEKRRKKKVAQKGRNTCIPKEIKAIVALVTLALGAFDLYADGSATRVFIVEEMSYLTYAMLLIMFVACILFFLQLYAFYLRVRSLCCSVRNTGDEYDERDAVLLKRENRYLCCAETTGYLLLLLEDLPISILLLLVTFMPILDFGSSNDVDYCSLYAALFETSYVGWLALLASLVAAAWKFLLSFFYCSACCCMEWGGVEGQCLRSLCCCFRVLRPLLASVMVACATYIYYAYRHGFLAAQMRCHLDGGAGVDVGR